MHPEKQRDTASSSFLASLSWEGIVSLNRALCTRSNGAAHGLTKAAPGVQKSWEAARKKSQTLEELLDFLYQCHKAAPFLNFNGNVFGEVARQLVAVSLLGMPGVRIETAASLAAHCVAGVLDVKSALSAIRDLTDVEPLVPGDRVSTLKSSRKGTVTRVLPDGRVAWLPDGRKLDLLAAPEDLLKVGPGPKGA